MPTFDPALLRPQFPALALEQDGRPVVFLDGPGGTQVPQRVIDAVGAYYREANANAHGAFATSVRSDAILRDAHAAVADLLGAGSPAEVKFGQNMTSLTFALSRAIGRTLRAGDEVVISRLDHEANRGPWIAAAADAGATVREIECRPGDVHPRPCVARRRPLGAHSPRRRRLRVECRGDREPGGRDRPAGACGRRLDLRRRGPLRAARPASTSSRSAPTSWPARPTSSSGRTSGSCGAAPRSWTRSPPTRSGRPRTTGRRAPRTTKGSPARWRPSSTSPTSASGSARVGPGDPGAETTTGAAGDGVTATRPAGASGSSRACGPSRPTSAGWRSARWRASRRSRACGSTAWRTRHGPGSGPRRSP